MWIRIDDGFADHPKIIKAGPLAIVAQIRALCYCARHLTDGWFPARIAIQICADLAPLNPAQMCLAKLWQKSSKGFSIHDFLEYQPNRTTVLQLRKKKAEAGRLGGLAKALARASASARGSAREDFYSPTPTPKRSTSKKTRAITPVIDSENGPAGQPASAMDHIADVIARIQAKNPELGEPPLSP